MQIINSKIDGLIDINGPLNGWGPIEGGTYYGNPNLPTSMSLETATAASTPGDIGAGWISITPISACSFVIADSLKQERNQKYF